MKVLVKNNRLRLEGAADNFSSLSEARVKELATKWQIGLQSLTKTTVQVQKDGRVFDEDKYLYKAKPREVLEEEIRKLLTITLDIPKEYWNEAQQHAWTTNNVDEVRDVSEERRLKEDAGIYIELNPFETDLDSFRTVKLLAELTEEQWDFFKSRYNIHYKETGEKDEAGRAVRKITNPRRLEVHEYVPESDEDISRLEGMESKSAKETLKKHGKSKTK